MRGRRGQSPAPAQYNSPVTQPQVKMTPRKQMTKEADASLSGKQQSKEEMQEDEVGDDTENKEELPSTREKRRRGREKKSAVKEMTEEEMMDLALRLSEQEASASALRLQQEQDAMKKAIEESMANQTQPCPDSQSQSLLTDIDTLPTPLSRRRLLYPNAKGASSGHQGTSEATGALEADLSQDLKKRGDENNNRSKKRKRKDGSPLLEMPDLSQTQKIYSQTSPFSSQSVSVPLDTQQDSDLTQIDHCQQPKSPVTLLLPPLALKPEVCVTKLSQELLDTCNTSGFVLCSQETSTSTQKCLPSQPKSPTFPKSSTCSKNLDLSKSTTFLKSPFFSETDQEEDGEVAHSPEYSKSPVFGRTNENQGSPQACEPKVQVCKLSQELQTTCEKSGLILCSQESLATSEKPLSCQPKSPVFPRSPGISKNLTLSSSQTPQPKSPVFSEMDKVDDGETQQSHGSSISPVFGKASPVFGKASQHQMVCLSPQSTEYSECSSKGNSPANSGPDTRNRPQCLRKGSGIDHDQGDKICHITVPSTSGHKEKSYEISKDCSAAGMELTSDMTLHWSDEDEDETLVDSPSPVFPSEKPLHQPHNHSASPSQAAAAFAGTSSPSRSLRQQRGKHTLFAPSSSAASSSQHQQQLAQTSTAEQGSGLLQSQGLVSGGPVSSVGPGGQPTVHYYWGVPFCPRGLDPDAYTQVIMAQMEVYEKSLKHAQRRLLRKAEWGEAILPQAEKSPSPVSPAESPQLLVPRRHGLRLRDKGPSEELSAPPAEEEEEEEKKEGEEDEENGEIERKNNGEEEPGGGEVDMSDCEVCPETQLSEDDDSTQLIVATNTGAEPQPKSPMLPEIGSVLRQWLPDKERQQEEEEEEMEVDTTVDRKTESNIPVSSTNGGEDVSMLEEWRDAEAEQIQDRAPQKSVSPEVEATASCQSPELSVDCPICQGSFPAAEIEMHAAYCDGEVEVVEELMPETDRLQASLRPRRQRSRRREATAEETAESSNLGRSAPKREKCYVCQKAIPLKDYSRHTEDCIQRQPSNTALKGKLLSALERTESRDSEAGPSGSTFSSRPGDVIDLRFQEEEEEFRISNSPIRAFTPISEATDCLVDFKKQHRARKPSQRRR
ncbi:uncharacterized protein uimc1 isoform X2 [Myripristis murdjan]|uniref:uncharacterized protein uimc1 isoform X2 n=1 Tax=Myripristis murdjan TaxID=586833 RepID=UPI0011761296|nr:BRCA1-A complex subunit RAP80 isoform X2 [Myripristis murdjan]